MVLAGVSTGKLQIRMLWLSSFSIRQFDWLGFLSIVCELSTKVGTVRDPSECADASKIATRCRSDACGSYLKPVGQSWSNFMCSIIGMGKGCRVWHKWTPDFPIRAVIVAGKLNSPAVTARRASKIFGPLSPIQNQVVDEDGVYFLRKIIKIPR